MTNERGSAGLLGFLLALATLSPLHADAAPVQTTGDDALEGRLTRLSTAFRQAESDYQMVPSNAPIEVAAVFLNSAPSFRNSTGGWLNRVTGWHNAGTFYNAGVKFLNNIPSFRNYYGGWPNHVHGWVNGGGAGFRNGGGFANGGGGFRNGGGFANGGGFRNGGGFVNR
jgi:rSAM-associated Gly-rich repeat protein